MTGGWSVREVEPGALASVPLLDGAPLQSSVGWWRAVARGAIPDGARPLFLLASCGGSSRVLFPILVERGGSGALVTPYTCLFQPPVREASDLEAAAPLLARRFGPVFRIDAIDPAWEGWRSFARGLRRAGRGVHAYRGFANRHERLAESGWDAYLAGRAGPLRATIRRRLARIERDPDMVFALHRDAAAAIAAYEAASVRSWKAAEPYPDFLGLFAREAAQAGCLRASSLTCRDKVVAAQYWTVENGCALVHKLAHDEELDSMSPGTALTAWTVRHLLEADAISGLDFGRGDDPYKSGWARDRRERGGLLVTDLRSPAGLAAAARQVAGAIARRRGAA